MPRLLAANEVRSFSYELTYADLVTTGAGAQDAITLHPIVPAGWQVDGVLAETTEAFNGSGTRVLNIGVAGALTGIVNALDIKAAAQKAPTVTKRRFTAPAAVMAQLVTADNNPTEGRVRVTLILVQVEREN